MLLPFLEFRIMAQTEGPQEKSSRRPWSLQLEVYTRMLVWED